SCLRVQIVAPDMSRRKESENERVESHDGFVPLRECTTMYVAPNQLRDHFATVKVPGPGERPLVVCIDEAQFFSDLVETCCALRRLGVVVVVAGLSLTFERQAFGEMHPLLDYADE